MDLFPQPPCATLTSLNKLLQETVGKTLFQFVDQHVEIFNLLLGLKIKLNLVDYHNQVIAQLQELILVTG